jgi:peptidylprolyl isomerase
LLFSFLFAAVTGVWTPVDPQNAIVIDSTRGRIVVALQPRLAPYAVARVKRLARMHVYDGLLMWRVLDTPAEAFIQTGDPGNVDSGRSSLPDLKAEFTSMLPVNDVTFVRKGSDPEGFFQGMPVNTQIVAPHASTVRAWGAYCPGTVGMGRSAGLDTANAEIFLMRGTTRWFDHDYTAIGRVVMGMDVVRAAAVGVPPKHPDAMRTVRVLSDLPASQQPRIETMNTESSEFAKLVESERRAKGADFSVCDVTVPSRVIPE